MKNSTKNVALTSVDVLFTTEEEHEETKWEKVQNIPLSELHPFRDHPFNVVDDDKMQETVDSIREYGVLVPIIARPKEAGGYEIVSGHRRCHASELAGLETVPVIVRNLDDDEATLIMVDSNLQRESLLPSERAKAYKMKLDAMKRRAGRPAQNNLSQFETNKRSDIELGEQVGESRATIQRYIRLTELIPDLLDMVDDKKLNFNSAEEISYLPHEEQQLVHETIVVFLIFLTDVLLHKRSETATTINWFLAPLMKQEVFIQMQNHSFIATQDFSTRTRCFTKSLLMQV